MQTLRTRALIGLAILAVIIAAGVAIWFSMKPSVPDQLTVYRNSRYDYTLAYLNTYDLKEYTSINVAIGHATDEGGMESLVEVTAVTAQPGTWHASFLDFVVSEMSGLCAADSPTVTMSCTGIASQEEYTASTGLTGVMFYLNQEVRNMQTGETSTALKGPFYAFDRSDLESEAQYAAVVVRPPTALSPDGTDAKLIEEIANTMQIRRPVPAQ